VDLVPPTATIQEVLPNVRTDAVATLDVTFSEPINAATFTAANLNLQRDGQSLAIFGASIAPVNPSSMRISGLTALTATPGSYALTLNLTGVEDTAGMKGAQSVTRTWL